MSSFDSARMLRTNSNVSLSGMSDGASGGNRDNRPDPLVTASSLVFDDLTMTRVCGRDVTRLFNLSLTEGTDLSKDMKQALADGLFKWARENGASHFAHWFFPCRMGSGAVGGSLGALKMDTLLDLQWGSKSTIKPFEATLPYERLFCGETGT